MFAVVGWQELWHIAIHCGIGWDRSVGVLDVLGVGNWVCEFAVFEYPCVREVVGRVGPFRLDKVLCCGIPNWIKSLWWDIPPQGLYPIGDPTA